MFTPRGRGTHTGGKVKILWVPLFSSIPSPPFSKTSWQSERERERFMKNKTNNESVLHGGIKHV